MGGQAEDTITPQTTKQAPTPEDSNILLPPSSAPVETSDEIPLVGSLEQAIRYHVSGSEVHFHVDPGKGPNTEKMKVAIPVADWYIAFEKLKNLRETSYQYIDHAEGCMLQIRAGINSDRQFELLPTLSKISEGTGPIFDKLEVFTASSRKKKSKK